MDLRRVLPQILTLAGIGALAGCGLSPSAQTRVRVTEKVAAFNQLTPKQQGDILGGAIERGNTKDMVYMALGRPKRIVTSADSRKVMWVYVENYAVGPAFTAGFNGPNATHYAPGFAGATSPPVIGGPRYLQPGGAGDYPFMQTLTPQEMKTKTVYVFFFEGKVVEIKLDGDASDQLASGLNKPLPEKPRPKFPFPRSAYGGFDE